MTPRLSSTYTGDQPALLWWISSPSSPSIFGMLGPHMSISRSPTCSNVGQSYYVSRFTCIIMCAYVRNILLYDKDAVYQ